jgi:cytochrome c551/c552
MKTNGGAVYEARSTALTKGEACLACHGAGKDYDAAVVHQ